MKLENIYLLATYVYTLGYIYHLAIDGLSTNIVQKHIKLKFGILIQLYHIASYKEFCCLQLGY